MKSKINIALASWGVHLFTSLGSIVALISLYLISKNYLIETCYFIFLSVVIDSFDGMLARKFDVKNNIKTIDGSLLDNIIDFSNYTIVPAFFILHSELVISYLKWPLAFLILIASCFQFSRTDAKTKDNCFLGFPSLWNILVTYLFILNTDSLFNSILITFLSISSFTRFKFPHLYRLNFIIKSKKLRLLILFVSFLFLLSCGYLLFNYKQLNNIVLGFNILCTVSYLAFSIKTNFRRKKQTS